MAPSDTDRPKSDADTPPSDTASSAGDASPKPAAATAKPATPKPATTATAKKRAASTKPKTAAKPKSKAAASAAGAAPKPARAAKAASAPKADAQTTPDPASKSEPAPKPAAPATPKPAAPQPAATPSPPPPPAARAEPASASRTGAIDAEFEPAPDTKSGDSKPNRADQLAELGARPIPFGLAVALAAGAGIIGAMVAGVFSGGGSGEADPRTIARLGELETRLDTMRTALAGVDGDGVAAAALADIQAEIDAVSARVDSALASDGGVDAASSLAMGDLASRLDAATSELQRVAGLAEDAAAAPAAQSAAIDALSARVDAVTDTVTAQQSAIDELSEAVSVLASRMTGVPSPTGGGVSGAAAALALASLQDAAMSGDPFAVEYAEAARRLPGVPAMEALGAFADAGAPTRADVAAAFRDTARRARDAERGTGGGLVDRVGRAMTGVVTIRRVDAPRTDAAADITTRAQARLIEDDLAGALSEMQRLQGPAREAAAEWIDRAERRVGLDAALELVRVEVTGG